MAVVLLALSAAMHAGVACSPEIPSFCILKGLQSALHAGTGSTRRCALTAHAAAAQPASVVTASVPVRPTPPVLQGRLVRVGRAPAQVLASLQLLDRLRQLATAEDPEDFALGYVAVLQVVSRPACLPACKAGMLSSPCPAVLGSGSAASERLLLQLCGPAHAGTHAGRLEAWSPL